MGQADVWTVVGLPLVSIDQLENRQMTLNPCRISLVLIWFKKHWWDQCLSSWVFPLVSNPPAHWDANLLRARTSAWSAGEEWPGAGRYQSPRKVCSISRMSVAGTQLNWIGIRSKRTPWLPKGGFSHCKIGHQIGGTQISFLHWLERCCRWTETDSRRLEFCAGWC